MTGHSAFDEVLAAAIVLTEIDDVARAQAWGSSALSVWREDAHASELDEEFIAWLAASRDVEAALVLLSVARFVQVENSVLEEARDRAKAIGWASHDGSAEPTRAWVVHGQTTDALGASSVGIGFRHSDGSELSMLAEIHDGSLVGIVLAPGPDELFDQSEDLVDTAALDVGPASAEVVKAWRELLSSGGDLPESVLVNQLIARDKLSIITGTPLDDLLLVSPTPRAAVPHLGPPGTATGLEADDEAERAELDAWASATLRAALQLGNEGGGLVAVERELLTPLLADIYGDYPRAEREAFAALEWADWLGAVIGIVRSGPGSAASGSALVDHVNRCPEVTSQIPRRDRPYYEAAFDHAVSFWGAYGLFERRVGVPRLTEAGTELLPRILLEAWKRS